jgi:enoyl-CoA hydratase/carnithine racemase
MDRLERAGELSADEADRVGLVQQVVELGAKIDRAREVARETDIASFLERRSAPFCGR